MNHIYYSIEAKICPRASVVAASSRSVPCWPCLLAKCLYSIWLLRSGGCTETLLHYKTCYKTVSGVPQRCLRCGSGVIQWYSGVFQRVSEVCQVCFIRVKRGFFGFCGLQLLFREENKGILVKFVTLACLNKKNGCNTQVVSKKIKSEKM